MARHCAICSHKKESHHDGKCEAAGKNFRDYCYCDKYRGRYFEFFYTHGLQRIFWCQKVSRFGFNGNLYRLSFMIVPGLKIYSFHWLRSRATRKWYE